MAEKKADKKPVAAQKFGDDRKKALLKEIEETRPAPVPELNFGSVDNDDPDNNQGDDDETE